MIHPDLKAILPDTRIAKTTPEMAMKKRFN